MDPIIAAILGAIGSGVVSSIATVAAIRVELRWLRRDVDRLNRTVFPTSPAPLHFHPEHTK